MKTKNHSNVINPEVEFPKVEKMLYNIAWKFAKKYPYPNEEEMFEECKSITYFAFMHVCHIYDATRGMSFSSRVHMSCVNRLRTFVTARTLDPLTFVEIDDELLGAANPLRAESLEMIEDLSADAKEIVSLLTETPSDLLNGLPATPRQLMRRIKEYMCVKRGRSQTAINAAHEELRVRFQSAWA